MSSPRALDGATERLVRTAVLIGLIPVVVVSVVLAVVVHPLVGALGALVAGGAWALFVRSRAAGAAKRALAPLPAVAAAPGSEPRLENLIEGICVVSGIEEPTVLVLPDTTLNAMVAADRSRATFVVTRGLIDGLGRVELEAVLANLAARVRTGAARLLSTASALPLPAGYTARVVAEALGEQSSIRADLDAVGLTKYPPGLIAALGVMEHQGTTVAAAQGSPEGLWIARTGNEPTGPAAGDLAPQPLPLRIAVLQEL